MNIMQNLYCKIYVNIVLANILFFDILHTLVFSLLIKYYLHAYLHDIVCITVSTPPPPQKCHPSFLPSPLLKSGYCPGPPFEAIPPYILIFWEHPTP